MNGNSTAWSGAGADRFDAALGGLGGCPFAPGASGNVAHQRQRVHMRAATPKPVVDKLTADIRTVVQSAAFKQKAQEQGATADYQTPQQLGDKVKTDLAGWASVVKSSKIEAE